MRWKIYEQAKAQFSDVYLTYGYVTKRSRIEHKLEKSHVIDARCISGYPLAQTEGIWYLIKFVRRNNRQLHKATIRKGGQRQRNIAPKEVYGFRLFDCVRYQNQICFVFGRRSSGYFDLRTLSGIKFYVGASYKKLSLIQRAGAFLVERGSGIPLIPEDRNILPLQS